VALFKTDCEEGRLQPTPAGHRQLATPRANYFLLVWGTASMDGLVKNGVMQNVMARNTLMFFCTDNGVIAKTFTWVAGNWA
jgi:hypothetical protein